MGRTPIMKRWQQKSVLSALLLGNHVSHDTALPWPEAQRFETNPFECHITSHPRMLFAPEDGEGGGGGAGNGDDKAGGEGGGKPPEKLQLTQEELDRRIEARLAKERKKYTDYDDLKSKAGKLSEMEKELSTLREKLELADKSDVEKQLASLKGSLSSTEKELKKLADEKIAAEQTAAKATARFRNGELSRAARAALTSKGALTDSVSLDIAVEAMLSRARPEYEEDEDGKVTIAFTLDEQRFTDPEKAAELFLSKYPVFAKAPGGGSGGSHPNGGRLPANLDDMSADQLLKAGWSRPAK